MTVHLLQGPGASRRPRERLRILPQRALDPRPSEQQPRPGKSIALGEPAGRRVRLRRLVELSRLVPGLLHGLVDAPNLSLARLVEMTRGVDGALEETSRLYVRVRGGRPVRRDPRVTPRGDVVRGEEEVQGQELRLLALGLGSRYEDRATDAGMQLLPAAVRQALVRCVSHEGMSEAVGP